MRAGEFPDGSHVLRAKIDMASPNINMRDPVLYRIRRAHHHRTGDAWCIYPMYDYAHPISDAIERITHSICTLEFEDHRPLYDWLIDNLPLPGKPQQIEFARLNLTYTVMSKRKLLQLVNEKHVSGWDDPRMPTICGMRRRGYTPEAIRRFCDEIGVAKRENVVDVGLLEFFVREDLNKRAPRAMAVLRPLRVVIENYPGGPGRGHGRRQQPGGSVRGHAQGAVLAGALHRAGRLPRGSAEEVLPPGARAARCGCATRTSSRASRSSRTRPARSIELRCTYDPATRGGDAPDGRKVKATLHWVSAAHAVDAEVRLYDRLFTVEIPGTGDTDFLTQLNPHSLEVVRGAKLEPSLAAAAAGARFQFERLGYFCADPDIDARRAGVQSHGDAERHVGEDRGQDEYVAGGLQPAGSPRLLIARISRARPTGPPRPSPTAPAARGSGRGRSRRRTAPARPSRPARSGPPRPPDRSSKSGRAPSIRQNSGAGGARALRSDRNASARAAARGRCPPRSATSTGRTQDSFGRNAATTRNSN